MHLCTCGYRIAAYFQTAFIFGYFDQSFLFENKFLGWQLENKFPPRDPHPSRRSDLLDCSILEGKEALYQRVRPKHPYRRDSLEQHYRHLRHLIFIYAST